MAKKSIEKHNDKANETNIVYFEKTKKYRVTFYYGKSEDGKTVRRYKNYSNKKDALKALKSHEAQRKAGLVKPKDLNSYTLSQCMEHFISGNQLADTTMDTYRTYINRINTYPISKKDVRELNKIDFDMFQKNIKSKYNLSNETINKYCIFITSVLNYALKGINDIDFIPALSKHLITKQKVENKFKGNCLEDNERIILYKIIDEAKDPRIHVAASLAAWQGIRRGEVLGLRWKDIDFKNNTIKIRNTRTQSHTKIVEKGPKSNAGIRDLTMFEHISNLLKEVKEYQENDRKKLEKIENENNISLLNSESFIYVMSDRSGCPIRPNYLSQLWKEFLEDYNKNNPNSTIPVIRFHDLRHIYASISYQNNIQPKNLAAELGHATEDTTNKVYTHLNKDDRKRMENTQNKALNEILNKGIELSK